MFQDVPPMENDLHEKTKGGHNDDNIVFYNINGKAKQIDKKKEKENEQKNEGNRKEMGF